MLLHDPCRARWHPHRTSGRRPRPEHRRGDEARAGCRKSISPGTPAVSPVSERARGPERTRRDHDPGEAPDHRRPRRSPACPGHDDDRFDPTHRRNEERVGGSHILIRIHAHLGLEKKGGRRTLVYAARGRGSSSNVEVDQKKNTPKACGLVRPRTARHSLTCVRAARESAPGAAVFRYVEHGLEAVAQVGEIARVGGARRLCSKASCG